MPEQSVSRVLALSALVGVLVLSFLPAEVVDPFRLKVGDSTEIGHVLAYTLLTSATMSSVPKPVLTLWLAVGVALSVSALGLGIELLQPLAGRTISMADFAQNEVGVAGGNALYFSCVLVQRIRVKDRIPRSSGG